MSDSAPDRQTEDELEAFRQRWRQEVTARTRRYEALPQRNRSIIADASPSVPQTARRPSVAQVPKPAVHDFSEHTEPRNYHDLPNKEENLKLENAGQNHDRDVIKEPVTALEHYELAVHKETTGQLGDSLTHYRKAFKLDENVDQSYKKKHFPNQPKTGPSNTQAAATTKATDQVSNANIHEYIKQFAALRIEPPPPPTDASPQQRSFFGELPEEILVIILGEVAMTDVASLGRLALVCKKLAHSVMTEESIWRTVVQDSRYGFAGMLYQFRTQIEGKPLSRDDQDLFGDEREHQDSKHAARIQSITQQVLHTRYHDSWRQLFRTRPRIRFGGCYISTVNYTRSGGNNSNTLSWGVPVHMVTYYRYLRFFRDGTVISLLTTTEPADVVHHLVKENLHKHHGNVLPSAVMKDALRGRWRLTGPASGQIDGYTGEEEVEGDVLVETQGVVPRYRYIMRLALSHAGKSTRNNKLAWRTFSSYNVLTDDLGDFTLKNDKAFYWSRVKSFDV